VENLLAMLKDCPLRFPLSSFLIVFLGEELYAQKTNGIATQRGLWEEGRVMCWEDIPQHRRVLGFSLCLKRDVSLGLFGFFFFFPRDIRSHFFFLYVMEK
jgi:hypothetical protein